MLILWVGLEPQEAQNGIRRKSQPERVPMMFAPLRGPGKHVVTHKHYYGQTAFYKEWRGASSKQRPGPLGQDRLKGHVDVHLRRAPGECTSAEHV